MGVQTDQIIINSGSNLDFYGTTSVTLDGNFSSGVAHFTRIGNMVIMTGSAPFVCASGTTANSTAAVGVDYRPSTYVPNNIVLEGYMVEIGINTNGTIYAEFRDYTGSLTAQTTTVAVPSMCYLIV